MGKKISYFLGPETSSLSNEGYFSFCVLALSIDKWISIVSIQFEEIFIAVKHNNNYFLQSSFMNNFVNISVSGCSKVLPFLHFVVFVL